MCATRLDATIDTYLCVWLVTMTAPSVYTPTPGHVPPEPGWKQSDTFSDVVPPRRPTFVGEQ